MSQSDYHTYVTKTLKGISDQHHISQQCKSEISGCVDLIKLRLATTIGAVLDAKSTQTVQTDDVRTAVNIVFGLRSEETQTIQKAITTAVDAFAATSTAQKVAGEARQRIEKRVGLTFPVSRTRTSLKVPRISKVAGVAATAVLEAVCGLLLKATIAVADSKKRATLSSRHLRIGLRGSKILEGLKSGLILAGGV